MEAEPYREKLLALPSFLLGEPDWTPPQILQGLELTGHFLSRHVFMHPHSQTLIKRPGDLPPARQRLADFYRRITVPEAEQVVA
jgi:DNA repair protein RecO (recombination protein O)